MENSLVLSSQIYLGLLEPVKQINVILQISICCEGKQAHLHIGVCWCVCECMNLYLCVCMIEYVCVGHLCQQF